jgi:hypothetical protein
MQHDNDFLVMAGMIVILQALIALMAFGIITL